MGLDAIVTNMPTAGRSDVADNDLVVSVTPDEAVSLVGHYLRMTSNGRLAPGSSDEAPSVATVSQLASEVGVGVDQLAIASALQQPWMPRVLSGAVTISQVESHLAGAEIHLSPQILDEVANVAEDPDEYWTARSRRTWG